MKDSAEKNEISCRKNMKYSAEKYEIWCIHLWNIVQTCRDPHFVNHWYNIQYLDTYLMCPFLNKWKNCRFTVTSPLLWLEHTTFCNLLSVTYVEGRQRLTDALLNEVVCDASRGMFIKNRVHQGDLGSAASRLCLGGTELSNSEPENMH